MYRIDDLAVLNPSIAEAGKLLLQPVGETTKPALTMRVVDGTREVPALLHFEPSNFGAYQIKAATGAKWISVEHWELRVDPESSYTSFQGHLIPGDAFLWGGQTGFIANFNFSTGYVSTEGQLMEGGSWDDYTGFRRWQILVWPDPESEPIALIDRNPG
ncbi:hypothetical protein [Sphingopyxis sp. GW247-27LB]|uniref:hypothetical protein n=1 Tax=Sphingopyxis sp. GW247-27LB TaxID=2012632 RepID=UPI000BA78213|nr:hypothetical protein [Sphingopyxis sp. GW247-27LB]PAL24530.1 hypothetical protein CD928_03790 [Sphingopyxis sp. GW247-27LB]